MFLYIKGTALKEPYMAEGAGFWGVLESLYLCLDLAVGVILFIYLTSI